MERICHRCRIELETLEPQFSRRKTDRPHLKDALFIAFIGGYGMHYDGPNVTLAFCDDCADIITQEAGVDLSKLEALV